MLLVVIASVLSLAVLPILFAYHLLKVPINVPGDLPEKDKRAIVRLAKWKTCSYAADRFRNGEFREAIRALKVLHQQQINELRKMSDGTHRAYVVVLSDEEPDGSGFYAWMRHQLIKTNGTWQIIRSY